MAFIKVPAKCCKAGKRSSSQVGSSSMNWVNMSMRRVISLSSQSLSSQPLLCTGPMNCALHNWCRITCSSTIYKWIDKLEWVTRSLQTFNFINPPRGNSWQVIWRGNLVCSVNSSDSCTSPCSPSHWGLLYGWHLSRALFCPKSFHENSSALCKAKCSLSSWSLWQAENLASYYCILSWAFAPNGRSWTWWHYLLPLASMHSSSNPKQQR